MSAALEAIDQVIARAGDADDVLRAVLDVLVTDGGCDWAGILFVESGELVLGPEAGTPRPDARAQVAVEFQGDRIAELVVDGCDDRQLLEGDAARISEYCLVGWDTGGVPWDLDA
jgi:putative methionine-R-sulfoxide reductase with GAF domain